MIQHPEAWTFQPLTEQQAQELCTWKYEPPYDVYNWTAWETLVAKQEEIGDPLIREQQYFSITDSEGNLIGFAQLFPMVGVTRLGLGMNPLLLDQGLGPAFVRLIAEEARRRAPENEIDLEVKDFNKRAFRAYEKAGFVHTDTYEKGTPTGAGLFHCMVYKGG